MRIASEYPRPPREITMAFPESDGWAIIAALIEYAESHPNAAHADHWRDWAKRLDEELRKPARP